VITSLNRGERSNYMVKEEKEEERERLSKVARQRWKERDSKRERE
jgi:hypothetical protein